MTLRNYDQDGSLEFPVRLLTGRECHFKFDVNLGTNLKYKLRSVAKRHFSQIYFKKVTFPTRPDLSEELKMTAGRWLFGIPDYKGHIVAFDDTAYIPEDSPSVILELMNGIQKHVNGVKE